MDWIPRGYWLIPMQNLLDAQKSSFFSSFCSFLTCDDSVSPTCLIDYFSANGSEVTPKSWTVKHTLYEIFFGAAYLSKLIEYGIDDVKYYDKSMLSSIASETLQLPIHTKLNKLKKTLGEAFFYWLEIQKIVKE